MTPPQVKAWDSASIEQRALWLMTLPQRRAWDGASPGQRVVWLALWSAPEQEEWCSLESWWRIGLPDRALSGVRDASAGSARDVARRHGQMERSFEGPLILPDR